VLESVNPATGDLLVHAENSTQEDVALAVDTAREAFDSGEWSRGRPHERTNVLGRIAELLRQDVERLSVLLTLENGKPLADARGEIQTAANVYDYYASAARHIVGKIPRYGSADVSLVVHEPVGVCGLIVPWNSPLSLLSWKLGAALAAGCTTVVKPSEYTSGITMEFIKLVDSIDGLPKGVVNAITGPGDPVGSELVKHRGVDKISFTGSSETGSKIMEMAASNLKKINLECGGKSANIIFDDCNMKAALHGSIWGIFRSAGQSCNAGSRLLVQDTVYKDFLWKYVQLASKIRVGNGLAPQTDIGPLISEKQMNRVLNHVESGIRQGAKLTLGGKRISRGELAKGFFVQPTIFEEVTTKMKIFQEEIFGPVLCVLPFHNADEAIEIANATKYGLAGNIWSRNLIRIMKVARGVRTGTVWVNRHLNPGPEVPFGGYKLSGVGRETGTEGLMEYLQTKHISLQITDSFDRVRR
jgi:betaine-aldehyde dehydrogenase